MYIKSFVFLASAALFLGGCSRHEAVATASTQGPTPEPVERTGSGSPPQPGDLPASPYNQPAPYANPANPAQAALATSAEPAPTTVPAPSYDSLRIPAGTPLRVRLDESVGTKYDSAGARFYATLTEPVVEDGRTLLPAGTRFAGRLTESKPSGHLKGRAVLALHLDGVDWRGRTYPIETSSYVVASHGRKHHDLRWIGGGGGIGAAIGAIAGGGEGALIGAAAGAGAGTAGALAAHRKQVQLRAETPITFRLRAPVEVR